ncbi:Siderophore iron transporter ARN2 [Rhizoctonia solani]|uniref:Siderophore iron transporter ARN2 n=1 Tax=Rhizoctonia solani TaxID=456999 RepID=A0A0K6FXZ9_9AGAM|nr:Siderophore iron transporter ARN2 [Rhizoctonia solani]
MDSDHNLLPAPRDGPANAPRKVHGVALSHGVSQKLRRSQTYVLWAVFGATIFMNSLIQWSASIILRIYWEASPDYVTKLLKGNHLVYAFAPLVFGRLADAYSRPISLTVTLLLFVVGCIISAASPNTAAFAVGTIFGSIGMTGIVLLSVLVVGDHTTLKWRGVALACTYLPTLIVIWAGPALLVAVAWRWTYGIALIVVFILCAPALYLLLSATRSHHAANPSLSTLQPTRLKDVSSQMDLVGLLIFTLGFALTEYSSTTVLILRDRHLAEYSPGRIAMLVVGLLLIFPGFIIWELYYASFPLMPRRVVIRKAVLLAITVSFLFRLASEFTSGNIGTFIPWMWRAGDTGLFFAAASIAYYASAPLLGVGYYVTRRYKPFLIIGNVLFIVGCGLWLHAARHWDPEVDGVFTSKAYLFTTQALIGIGNIAVDMSVLIGSQAAVTHDDLAIVTALVFVWTRVAGSLGSSAAVAIALRFDSDRVKSTISLGLGLGLSILCLILSLFVPNFVLRDKHNAVETED